MRIALEQTAVRLQNRYPYRAIRIDEVFRAASVPEAGYLHAKRLHLVDIVRATLNGWTEPEAADPYGLLDPRW
jgi:hypothetical protein